MDIHIFGLRHQGYPRMPKPGVRGGEGLKRYTRRRSIIGGHCQIRAVQVGWGRRARQGRKGERKGSGQAEAKAAGKETISQVLS